MYWFVVKKYLLDIWDNLMSVVLFNFFYLASLAVAFVPIFFYYNESMAADGNGFVLKIKAASEAPPIGLLPVFFLLALVLVVLLTAIFSRYAADIANYQKPARQDFFRYLGQSWRSALAFFGFLLLLFAVFVSSTSFYGRLGGLQGELARGLVYALLVFGLLSFQFWFAYRNETGEKVGKTLAGLFRFFGRNPLFSLFSFVLLPTLASISFFTLLLVPGPFGLLLWSQVAYRQWRKKELYLEEHPEAKGKPLYAKTVFAEDIFLQGERTFKTMFMPWKT